MKAQAYKLPAIAAIFLSFAVLAVAACGGAGGTALPSDLHTLQLKTPLASPTPPPQRQSSEIVYVSNFGSNNVTAYAVDLTSGGLASLVGSPFAASVGSWGITTDSQGRFAYATGNNTTAALSTVSSYSINAISGALTPIAGSPFPADHGCGFAAIDPSTRYAYASCWDNSTLVEYTVNASTGALTQLGIMHTISQSGSGAASVVIDPLGKFVYVPNNTPGNGSVSAYTINSGYLSPISGSPFAAGYTALTAAIDPSGKYLYATDNRSNDINGYSINAATGALTPLAGSPFATGAGAHPTGIAVDPSGGFVYVANTSAKSVSAYALAPTNGALTLVGSFPTGNGPTNIAIDTGDKFLFVTNNYDNTISSFSVNSQSGMLSPVGTYPTGAAPTGVTVVRLASPAR